MDKTTGKKIIAQQTVVVPVTALASISVPSNSIGSVGVAFDLSKGVSAKSATGAALSYNQLTVEVSEVSQDVAVKGTTFTPTHAGNYDISYTYQDPATGLSVSARQELYVPETAMASISAPSAGTATLGSNYDITKGVSGKTSNGSAIKFSDLDITVLYAKTPDSENLDPQEISLNSGGTSFKASAAGTYFVIYSYTDPVTGNSIQAQQNVTVSQTSLPSITAPSNTVATVNSPVDLSKGVSGTDSNGHTIDYSQMLVTVLGPAADAEPIILDGAKTFTPTSSGWWYVSYNYKDAAGNTAETTQSVYVPYAETPSITAPSVTVSSLGKTVDIAQGVSAKDSSGNPLSINALDIEGWDPLGNSITFNGTSFKATVQGNYQIIYSYTDSITGAMATASRSIWIPYTTTPSITVPSDSATQVNQGLDISKGVIITDANGKVISLTDPNVSFGVMDEEGNIQTLTKGTIFTPKADGEYLAVYIYTDPMNGNSVYATRNIYVGLTREVSVSSEGSSTASSGSSSHASSASSVASSASSTAVSSSVQKDGGKAASVVSATSASVKVSPKMEKRLTKAKVVSASILPLPKTGERDSAGLLVLGIAVVLGGFGLTFRECLGKRRAK